MRILALDVGDRRVGIAVCDEEGLIASPLTVLQRASKAQDFARLAQLVREQEVGFLVVGHPLNEDGSAGPQARRIERYAEALQEALRREGLDLPMVLWDESFSTQRAQEAMIASGRKARARPRPLSCRTMFRPGSSGRRPPRTSLISDRGGKPP